ncbi:MAG: PepSY-associated TM helix domain-containing protein [Dongiaceae bacterium]
MRVRSAFVLLHRWVGLTIAGFLFIAGSTGAVISWDHELDDWLNPHLAFVDSRGPYLPPLSLVETVERSDPRAKVTFVSLLAEKGKAISFFVYPRIDPATGKLYQLDYNQVFLDPVTGEILGRREWGKPALDPAHLVPFLYKLHYSLHVPIMWGTDRVGIWLMGGVALIWIVDCFVGFYLTLPGPQARRKAAPQLARPVQPSGGRTWWRRWQPAWRIKWRGSSYRVNFDIHRAFGLWFWVFLLILAISSASLNLYTEVAQPIVNAVSSVTPTPFDQRVARPFDQPSTPRISYAEALARARAEAARRGWREPAGTLFYSVLHDVYAIAFFEPGDDHGAAGVGPAELYLDGADGHLLGDRIPWTGTGGDLFLQIQFPLHSGRIAGLPGRIFISFTGLAVATLSVTGVVIWWRKRRARRPPRRVIAAGRAAIGADNSRPKDGAAGAGRGT